MSTSTAVVKQGASRGIGRATAQALANAGTHVIVHYGRAVAEAEALVSEIRAGGGRADAVTADVSVAEGPARLASQVRAIVGDHLDILVSNAGISKAAAIEDHTLEDFDHLFATNVRSPFFLGKELFLSSRRDRALFLSRLSRLITCLAIPGSEALHRFPPMRPRKVRSKR